MKSIKMADEISHNIHCATFSVNGWLVSLTHPLYLLYLWSHSMCSREPLADGPILLPAVPSAVSGINPWMSAAL